MVLLSALDCPGWGQEPAQALPVSCAGPQSYLAEQNLLSPCCAAFHAQPGQGRC